MILRLTQVVYCLVLNFILQILPSICFSTLYNPLRVVLPFHNYLLTSFHSLFNVIVSGLDDAALFEYMNTYFAGLEAEAPAAEAAAEAPAADAAAPAAEEAAPAADAEAAPAADAEAAPAADAEAAPAADAEAAPAAEEAAPAAEEAPAAAE